MAVNDIKNKIHVLTQDGVLDHNDLKEVAEAAGGSINVDEMNAIRDAVLDADNVNMDSFGSGPTGYVTTMEAFDEAQRTGVRFPILGGSLVAVESLEEATSVRPVSFGGTEVPEKVKELLQTAYDNGLEPFDVNETKRKGDGEVKGIYTNYPSNSAPVENMTFDYTEITPEKLKADLEDTTLEYQVMVPKRVMRPGGISVTEIQYETRVGGTGNITSHYDESAHSDIYARGSSGQKWANNFAILSDGSIHALPAARRDAEGRVILTNPALARGKRVLYMGHLDVRGGVVQGVEMSGRLCKLAASGDQKFIDPIALLDAWGFEMSDSLRNSADQGKGVRFSNTEDGTPVRDLETGVIRNAEPQP
ncbi:MAG: hypothetical protein EP343_23460 [Deltaproteobacteria bacterium]|nr:MAG: hypothetical protein EP343_23460 [Deltaproteobacteria bacterium]